MRLWVYQIRSPCTPYSIYLSGLYVVGIEGPMKFVQGSYRIQVLAGDGSGHVDSQLKAGLAAVAL